MIDLGDISFHISIEPIGFYLPSEVFTEFSLQPNCPTLAGGNFQIYVV